MYRTIARFIPRKVRENFKLLIKQTDVKTDADALLGFIVIFGLGLSIFFSFITGSVLNINLIILAVIIFIFYIITIYMILIVKSNKKSKEIELVLPDALQLMSGNLRAGLTTDRALLLSSREEFGPLKVEIDTIGKEITSGKELETSLMNLTKRVRSSRLEKAIYLIVSGLKAGGELADLLDQTAENLRNEKVIDEKVRSNILLYVIFIFIAVGLGAPVLFGLSSYLVEIMTATLANVDIPPTAQTANLPLSLTKVTISVDFVIRFAITTLIMSSIMGSLIIGLIAKGTARDGFKYIPLLLIFTLTVFFVSRFLIKNLLSSVFGL
ncbi:type II secretion system F family protein [Candidatus Woesearchaeota archaeon]|nr:type II secretion system F family protein [Candidatus Woesearchaeota archaeon]